MLVRGEAGVGKSRLLSQIARRVARDAIVLPLHTHDVFSPALQALGRVMSEATLRISDDELRVMLKELPDVPDDVAQVRMIASALVDGSSIDRLMLEENLLWAMPLWIAALSRKAPVVLLIDDLDVAGTALQRVIWQTATLPEAKRVLVVATARAEVARTPPALTRMLASLHELGVAHDLPLAPLGLGDITRLVAQVRGAAPEDLVRRLHELSAGSPLVLAELLGLGSAPEVSEQGSSSPPRVRDLVLQRTAELGRASADFLAQASLFEHDFSVERLAEIAGSSVTTAQLIVDRSVTAGVLLPSAGGSYRFCHRLFRETLSAELTPAQRRRGASPDRRDARA